LVGFETNVTESMFFGGKEVGMKKNIRYIQILLSMILVTSVLFGCGASAVDTTADTTVNATTDITVDQAAESTQDTASDATTDTVAEAVTDSASESTEDANTETNDDESIGSDDNADSDAEEADAISVIPKADDPFEDDPSVGALLNLLEGIYSAAPGAAGSSIRLEYAAKELLDFSETYSGNISTVYLTMNANVWMDEKIENGFTDIRSDFAECLTSVKACAESIAEDPSVPTPLAEDYDYTLQYDSYDKEKLEEICHYIELATEETE